MSSDDDEHKAVAGASASDNSDEETRPKTSRAAVDSEESGSEAIEQPRKRVLKRRAVKSDASEEEDEEAVSGHEDVENSKIGRGQPAAEDSAPTRSRMDAVFGSDSEDEEPNDLSREAQNEDADDMFASGVESDGLAGEDREMFEDSDDKQKTSRKRRDRGEKGERKKKRRREDEDEYDDSQPSKPLSLLKMQIEEEKKKRQLKKQMVDEAAVEAWVQKVINDMKVAAEQDREANMEKKPGIHKLKMLPTVVEELRIRNESKGKRSDMDDLDRQELYIENGALTMIAAWLEPLPDKSLPSVQIRTAMLQALDDLPVDQHREELKESQVGHRVRYLSKHPKEILENKRRCEELMTKWARQVCNLPTDYRSMSIEERRDIARREREILEEKRRIGREAGISPGPLRRGSSHDAPAPSSQDLDDVLGSGQRAIKPGEPGWRRHATIPQATNRDYIVSPQVEVPDQRHHKKKGPNRMDALKKKAKDTNLKTKSNPLTKMSIEGRGL